jgi:hypothetical protein
MSELCPHKPVLQHVDPPSLYAVPENPYEHIAYNEYTGEFITRGGDPVEVIWSQEDTP